MYKYILYFIAMTIIGILYDKYKTKQELSDNKENITLIQKYLLNENALSGTKPIVWVHIDHEVNARNWLSFGSRNTTHLNQPYLYITIQSIINHAAGDFNVCLIDDDSFSKLIPGWSIDLHHLADPVKSHMRHLGISKLLYYYGGMLVPSSYLALQPLENIYNMGMKQNGLFVVETNPSSNVTTLVNAFPNQSFMGCTKHNETMKEVMLYMERTNSCDYTNAQDFLGQINRFLFEKSREGKATIVDGRVIGTKTQDSENVPVEELMGTSYINFHDSMNGILIPQNELLRRTSYGWFVRSSVEQIYNSNLILSKYMLLSNKL